MKGICATLVVLAFLAGESFCAERVDVTQLLRSVMPRSHHVTASESVTSYRFKRHASSLPMSNLDDVISLGPDTTLDVVKTTSSVQGTQVIKMQENFKGRVVPDGVVTIETDTTGYHLLDASGSVYRNIDRDLDPDSVQKLDPESALLICLAHNADEFLRDEVTNIKVEPEVLFDDNHMAYPAYLVQYLVQEEEGEGRRPTCSIDTRDCRVIMAWDALELCSDCTARGTGGNLNIGKIRYGDLQRCLKVRRENGTCYLENQYVRVINNNFTSFSNETASYNCVEIDDEVNGAYSPLLDALFYGTVVGRMYEDWYNMSPLGDRITLRVHYGANITTAFWNGEDCHFGDGGEEYHPLVSIDIVSHEIAHGVTERNSNLYYYQQWGGINEAFSDIAGEAAEAYLSEADWVTGEDVQKLKQPRRYFDNPELDNVSISHVDNFTEMMDPHHSSGVFNRVFFLVVHDQGLPVKEAFHVFLHANLMYWHHMPTFHTAACQIMKAAYDLGQSGAKFRKAFLGVGIDVCDTDDHVVGLRQGETYTDIKVSESVSPSFVFSVPGQIAQSVTVNTSTSGKGQVYIVVSNTTWGAIEDDEVVQVYAEGLEAVEFDVPDNTSFHVTITLFSKFTTPLPDVTLQAFYVCLEEYEPDMEQEFSLEFYFLWSKYCDKSRKTAIDNSKPDDESEKKTDSDVDRDETDDADENDENEEGKEESRRQGDNNLDDVEKELLMTETGSFI